MLDSETPPLLRRFDRPSMVVLAALFLALGVGLTGWRTWKDYSVPADEFNWQARGLSDFHNGSYFPSLAFRNGDNPYSLATKEKYTLARSSPIYSPVVFVWHVPFTYTSVPVADVAFFVFNTALLGGLAWLGICFSDAKFRWGIWLALFGVLVWSRPGHVTLFTGYFTAELVIGTIVALHFASSRPFLSGCGMLVASGKPTYVLPLTILMLCRRNYRAVGIGLTLCVIGGVLGLAWLASFSSIGDVVTGINEGRLALHDDPTEDPVNTWTRLDAVGVVAKVMNWKPGDAVYLISMLGLLAIPGWAIYRVSASEENRGATGLTALIVCLTILVSVYHHAYDWLLVAVPWVGLMLFRSIDRTELSKASRWAIVTLLAVPALNYFSTRSFSLKLGLDPHGVCWNSITSANGICLALALAIAVFAAFRLKTRST